MSRTEFIAAILIDHSTYHEDGDLVCRCGHVYKLGESIAAHRGGVIDAGLTLRECGASDDSALNAVRVAMELINAG